MSNIEALPRTLADMLRQVLCNAFYFLSFLLAMEGLICDVLCPAVVRAHAERQPVILRGRQLIKFSQGDAVV
jgi:hypothetical protein